RRPAGAPGPPRRGSPPRSRRRIRGLAAGVVAVAAVAAEAVVLIDGERIDAGLAGAGRDFAGRRAGQEHLDVGALADAVSGEEPRLLVDADVDDLGRAGEAMRLLADLAHELDEDRQRRGRAALAAA